MLYARARDALLDFCKQRASTDTHDQQPMNRFHSALCRLPMDTRILLDLRYVEQMSTHELSILYRVQRNMIRTLLREARRTLDEQLARSEPPPSARP